MSLFVIKILLFTLSAKSFSPDALSVPSSPAQHFACQSPPSSLLRSLFPLHKTTPFHGQPLQIPPSGAGCFGEAMSIAGRRMFQSPRQDRRLLLILSVRWHCTQESCLRNPCEVFMRAAIKPSFASLTSVHCHFCRFESKLSATVTSMSSPSGAGLLAINEKSTHESFVSARFSSSGTQD